MLDEALRLSERTGRSGSPVSIWATLSAELAMLEGDMAAVRTFLVEGRRRDPSALAGGEGLWYIAYDIDLAIESGELPSPLPSRPGTVTDSIGLLEA